MKFMNNKKSRVTDLFRKMDTDNDGLVPRPDFVDGIIKSSEFCKLSAVNILSLVTISLVIGYVCSCYFRLD